MKTVIYFVRHAEPNYQNYDDFSRELTAKGVSDSLRLVKHFSKVELAAIYSSPYKRAIDTVQSVADDHQLEIITDYDLRERKISNDWISNFNAYSKQQWIDFDFKLDDGESLQETQDRNLKAVNDIISNHCNQNIIIATHATALTTILNYYDDNFDYEYFNMIKDEFPFAVKCVVDNYKFTSIKTILL